MDALFALNALLDPTKSKQPPRKKQRLLDEPSSSVSVSLNDEMVSESLSPSSSEHSDDDGNHSPSSSDSESESESVSVSGSASASDAPPRRAVKRKRGRPAIRHERSPSRSRSSSPEYEQRSTVENLKTDRTREQLPAPLKPGMALRAQQTTALEFMRARELAVKWRTLHEPIPDQRHGVRGGIIMAKMGTGKTLMQLAAAFTQASETRMPTLIVTTLTAMREFRDAVRDFLTPEAARRVLLFHKDFMVRASDIETLSWRRISRYTAVVTTYETVRSGCTRGEFVAAATNKSDVARREHGDVLVSRRDAVQGALRGPGALFLVTWERMCLDESQEVRNPHGKLWRSAMAVSARYVWLFSGTPFVNSGDDIHAQLLIVGYRGANRIEWHANGQRWWADHGLKDCLLTLGLDDTQAGRLPPLVHKYVEYTLNDMDMRVYASALQITKGMIALVKRGDSDINFALLLVMFSTLRQCMIAPYLMARSSKRANQTPAALAADAESDAPLLALGDATVNYHFDHLDRSLLDRFGLDEQQQQQPAEPVEPEEDDARLRGEVVAAQAPDISSIIAQRDGPCGIYSTTATKVFELLRDIYSDAERERNGAPKVILFSHYVSALDLMAAMVEARLPHIRFVQVDGSVMGRARPAVLDTFSQDAGVSLLLMNSRVGGQGLNLQAANHIILLDPWWNDAVPNQCVARAHRPGQTRTVYVYELYRLNTIDEHIYAIRDRKDTALNEFLGDIQRTANGGSHRKRKPSRWGSGTGVTLKTLTRIIK